MSIQSEIDRLAGIKADLKAALAEKGQTVGDVFSTYPAAVRAIETGPKSANISADFYGHLDGQYITYIDKNGALMKEIPLSSVDSIDVINPSFIYFDEISPFSIRTFGDIEQVTGVSSNLFFVSGNCSISYEGM